jgi:hypothetical protein
MRSLRRRRSSRCEPAHVHYCRAEDGGWLEFGVATTACRAGGSTGLGNAEQISQRIVFSGGRFTCFQFGDLFWCYPSRHLSRSRMAAAAAVAAALRPAATPAKVHIGPEPRYRPAVPVCCQSQRAACLQAREPWQSLRSRSESVRCHGAADSEYIALVRGDPFQAANLAT